MRSDIARSGPSVAVSAPQPLEGWSAPTVDAWRDLWGSPLAAHYKPTDVAGLERLFTFRQRLAEALERATAEPESVGSMGQPIISPWIAEIHRLEASIGKLEDRYGLTPLARLRLGVTLEEGVSLAAKNAELLERYRDAQ